MQSHQDDWDRHWTEYAQANAQNPAQNYRHRLVLDLLRSADVDTRLRILDIGSGTGTLAAELRHVFPSAEIVGIELSREGVERARVGVPSATFVQRDVVNDDVDARLKGWATAAVCSEVLEHVDEPGQLLSGILPYLAPVAGWSSPSPADRCRHSTGASAIAGTSLRTAWLVCSSGPAFSRRAGATCGLSILQSLSPRRDRPRAAGHAGCPRRQLDGERGDVHLRSPVPLQPRPLPVWLADCGGRDSHRTRMTPNRGRRVQPTPTTRAALLAASAGVAAAVAALVWSQLPKQLNVHTDIVGYPEAADFNIERYLWAYGLVAGLFPFLTLGLYLLLRRTVAPGTARPLGVFELLDRRAPAAQGDRVSLATSAASIIVVGIALGFELAIGGGWQDYGGVVLAAAATGYGLLVACLAVGAAAGPFRNWELESVLSAVNALLATATILGLAWGLVGDEGDGEL